MKRLALVAALLLAGCGGTQPQPHVQQPHLSRTLAQALRAQTDAVAAALAAGDGCLARERASSLQRSVITAVNERRLPPRFQEPLLSAVNDLAGRIRCVPPPAPAKHEHAKPHEQHGHHPKGHKKK